MKKVLLLFIIMATLIFADLDGRGRGKNEVEAKNNALSDLSSKIQVEVKSEFNSKSTDTNYGYNFEDTSIINLKTENDFFGVEFEVDKVSMFSSEYKAVAILKSEKISLYYDRIRELDENISTNFKLTNTGSKSEKHHYLEKVLEDFKKREKYSYVIVALGGQKSRPIINKYSIERRKNALNKEMQENITIALNVMGDVNEGDRMNLQKELSSSIKDKRIVIKYVEDGSEDYYVDFNVIESKEEKIPETYIMPEMTNIKINAFMEVIDSNGETMFSQNILGEAEEIDRRQTRDLVLEIIKLNFNENLKVILEG